MQSKFHFSRKNKAKSPGLKRSGFQNIRQPKVKPKNYPENANVEISQSSSAKMPGSELSDAILEGFKDQEILEIIKNQNKPFKLEKILRLLPKKSKKNIKAGLSHLAQNELIARLPNGTWQPISLSKTAGRNDVIDDAKDNVIIEGVFQMNSDGSGKIVPLSDGAELPPISVSEINAGNAWHKDTVKCLLTGFPPRAAVIDIIKRVQNAVPARVIKKQGKFLLCRSAVKNLPAMFRVKFNKDLFVPAKALTLVTVKPEIKLAPNLWQGSIVQIYEKEDIIASQEEIVKTGHNVPCQFPHLALQEAQDLPKEPDNQDFLEREDLRDLPFVTIDGADAKDFDDAIHVMPVPDGWILQVAIADVSHYVPLNQNPASLDGEARFRANSWYFPTSVEPMLPRALSNGLCSLNPHVNRLAMLAEIHFSSNGEPLNARFAPIVIRSHARLTYDEAAAFFAQPACTPNIDNSVKKMLLEAGNLYKALKAKRHKDGMLDFELPEAAYDFSRDGQLEGIKIAERNDAHKLIEEFMIAANEAVAVHLGISKLPFPWRDHPAPEQMKLEMLFETLRLTCAEILPPNVKPETLGDLKTIQKILENAQGTSYEYVVNRLCLRAMAQARYEPENLGHFGLASKAYCHFTSPIRRYADLLTHRALKASLGIYPREKLEDFEELKKICEHLNTREREALECEREIAKRLGCLSLKNNIGQIFEGSISGVTEFGLFVEFNDLPVEGLIRMGDIKGDWYEVDKARQMIIGKNTGRIFHLGQKIKARILEVNPDFMEIRLGIEDREKTTAKKVSKNNLKKKVAKRVFSKNKNDTKKNPEKKAKSTKKDKAKDKYRNKNRFN